MTTLALPQLDRVRIASPCEARWEDMVGDDRTRHCALCNLNVHNLSAMTRAEAETLLADRFHADGSPREGRFCARLFRRADGTVITQDCPRGLARIRAAARAACIRIAASIGLLAAVGWITTRATRADGSLVEYEPFASLVRTLNYAGIVKPQPVIMGKMVMGDIAFPPPPNNQQPVRGE